jgi:hypothetical protein
MSKFFVFFILLCGLSANLFSQASSSIGAQVVEPITVTKTADLNFRNVAIIFAGTVEMKMISAKIQPGLPNILLPVGGTFTAVTFVVEGTSAYAFTITVPPSPLEIKNGDNTLVVNSLSSDPILNPETDLYAGVFVSVTPLDVIVNYN